MTLIFWHRSVNRFFLRSFSEFPFFIDLLLGLFLVFNFHQAFSKSICSDNQVRSVFFTVILLLLRNKLNSKLSNYRLAAVAKLEVVNRTEPNRRLWKWSFVFYSIMFQTTWALNLSYMQTMHLYRHISNSLSMFFPVKKHEGLNFILPPISFVM